MARFRRRIPLLSLFSLMYVAGICSLLLYGHRRFQLARRTYVSENALLVNSGQPRFQAAHGSLASAASQRVRERVDDARRQGVGGAGPPGSRASGGGTDDWRRECARAVGDEFRHLGLETYQLTQRGPVDRGHRHHGNHHHSAVSQRMEYHHVYAVLRSGRADGTAALVLSVDLPPYWTLDRPAANGTVDSAGLAVSVAKSLVGAPWLAKDVIFLALDATAPRGGLDAWLRTYRGGSDELTVPGPQRTMFARAGAIFAAIHLEVWPPVARFDSLCFLTVGPNGRLPNLDLLNTAACLYGVAFICLYIYFS